MTKEKQKTQDSPSPTATLGKADPTKDFTVWANGLVESNVDNLSKAQFALLKSQIAEVEGLPVERQLPPDPTQPTIIRSEGDLAQLAAAVGQTQQVTINLLTTSDSCRDGEIVGMGLAIENSTFYVPLHHRFRDSGGIRPDQLPAPKVFLTLRLHDKELVAHDAKSELRWLQHYNPKQHKFDWDTRLAGKLLQPSQSVDLESLATRELDVPAWRLNSERNDEISFRPIDEVARSCAKNCWYTSLLSNQQRKDERIELLMRDVEIPLAPTVTQMEDAGYQVDVESLQRNQQTIELELQELKRQIADLSGDEEFNPNSSKQLQNLLFVQLGLESKEVTSTGQKSVGDSVLSRFVDEHGVVEPIRKYRKLSKLRSTFQAVSNGVDPDGRLRVRFDQLAAETGRIASKSLIQTLPKAGPFNIRNCFKAASDCLIVKADFAQQELCVLAFIAGEKNMLDALAKGTDLHGLAAVMVFNLDCEANDVKRHYPEQRDKIKAIQFGLIYGQSAFTLASDLGISRQDAEELVEEYFSQFPAVKAFIQEVHGKVVGDGYIDDMFLRRRYLPDAKLAVPRRQSVERNEIFGQVKKAKRAAQNFVVQGPAATITKLAMIRCDQRIQDSYGEAARLILTLHDELQFEVHENVADKFAGELPQLMCELEWAGEKLPIPLAVEVEVGPSWGETSPWTGGQNG